MEFWTLVDRRGPDECWAWQGRLFPNGYGAVYVRKGEPQFLAHRVAYEASNGPIPDGLVIDHLCRNRACVNPSHLEPVTLRTNLLRGETIPATNAAKTHCIHGHEFTPENTRVKTRTDSPHLRRICQQCYELDYQKRNAERSARRAAARAAKTPA
jgi:hypothetical protein